MSAKVKPGPKGVPWVAECTEHNAFACAGTMTEVDLWADVHNEEQHAEEA